MSLSPEDRERLVKAAVSAYHEYLSNIDLVALEPCFREHFDRALSPDPRPVDLIKDGQLVDWQNGVGDRIITIHHKGDAYVRPWRVIVTAEECVKALKEKIKSMSVPGQWKAGYQETIYDIERLINEAPRSK